MEDRIIHEAEIISEHLKAIRQILKQYAERNLAGSGLTVPQVNTIKALSKQDGQSLKDLSRELGLSHSTVSGIVDRLERHELIRRQVDEQDKRITRIYLTNVVNDYLKESSNQLTPLMDGLQRASAEERASILSALELLQRLMKTPS